MQIKKSIFFFYISLVLGEEEMKNKKDDNGINLERRRWGEREKAQERKREQEKRRTKD